MNPGGKATGMSIDACASKVQGSFPKGPLQIGPTSALPVPTIWGWRGFTTASGGMPSTVRAM